MTVRMKNGKNEHELVHSLTVKLKVDFGSITQTIKCELVSNDNDWRSFEANIDAEGTYLNGQANLEVNLTSAIVMTASLKGGNELFEDLDYNILKAALAANEILATNLGEYLSIKSHFSKVIQESLVFVPTKVIAWIYRI